MTLPDALAYARAHQPAILAALARVSGAREAAEVPRSQWLPRVGITAQVFAATENNSTASTVATMPEVDIPRIGTGRAVSDGAARWNPYGSTLVAAGGTQEVFDFGRIAAESAAADAKVEIAVQSAFARQIDIEYGVQEAYFAVYAAKGVLATAEGAYQRSREHRDLAQAGVGSRAALAHRAHARHRRSRPLRSRPDARARQRGRRAERPGRVDRRRRHRHRHHR